MHAVNDPPQAYGANDMGVIMAELRELRTSFNTLLSIMKQQQDLIDRLTKEKAQPPGIPDRG
jgi:hypothetical protein